MAERRGATTEQPGGRLGRDLLTPYILLILSEYQTHGYMLLQRLTEMGLNLYDPTTVYRTLRSMERDGLVTSRWDTGSDGPARRVYALTETGESMLRVWAGALDNYQRTLASFFDIYASLGKATLDVMADATDAARFSTSGADDPKHERKPGDE
jgi:PadR family transcriptional regulator, regulatory protein PadR